MTTSDLPSAAAAAESPKLSYLDLPCPVPYEDIHHESLMSLKLELIEGMRLDSTKRHNEKFCTSHSMMAGPTVIPSESSKIIKTPTTNYEFGANYTDSKLMLLGRMAMDGRLSAKLKYDFTHNLALKANAQLTDEPHKSHGLINFDYKGLDYRVEFQMGSGALLGATYIQIVSPRLSFGGEVFWAGQHRKSGFGYVARYNNDKMVATGQFRSSDVIALSYVHKVSTKAFLASDFMYNFMSKDVIASFGYDYSFNTKTQLRGKIDSNGVVGASLYHEEGVITSFEFDHNKQDYKFGLQVRLSY